MILDRGCACRHQARIAPLTRANVLRSGEGLIRSHAALLVVLTLWAFTPLVALTIYVLQHGGTLT